MTEPTSISRHLTMLSDRVRTRLYQQAIAEVVKPGDLVADIGTGTGILAFFALQAGARKVYAIEQTDAIEVAQTLAQLNGWHKKVVFIKGRSDKIELPQRVDVITSELIGFFGLDENVARFQVDARDRFLKKGGKLIPAWLELYLGPVESTYLWKEFVGVWNKRFFGCDFTPLREYAISQRYVVECGKLTQFLAPPRLLWHFDFYKLESPPRRLASEFIVKKHGHLHGFVGYFKTGLSPRIILSTAPQAPLTHWKQTFFPLPQAVRVRQGDVVSCEMLVIPFGDIFAWQWNTRISRKGVTLAQFSQNNFNIDKKLLKLIIRGPHFKPVLSLKGQTAQRILSLCDGKRTVEQIARLLQRAYPQEYKEQDEALRSVIAMMRNYAEL